MFTCSLVLGWLNCQKRRAGQSVAGASHRGYLTAQCPWRFHWCESKFKINRLLANLVAALESADWRVACQTGTAQLLGITCTGTRRILIRYFFSSSPLDDPGGLTNRDWERKSILSSLISLQQQSKDLFNLNGGASLACQHDNHESFFLSRPREKRGPPLEDTRKPHSSSRPSHENSFIP